MKTKRKDKDFSAIVAAKHTRAPITITEVVGGFALQAESVGKGYYSNIGIAMQRDPQPLNGGGISQETAAANAKLTAASPMLRAAAGLLVDELAAMHRHYHPECKAGCPTHLALDVGRAALKKVGAPVAEPLTAPEQLALSAEVSP